MNHHPPFLPILKKKYKCENNKNRKSKGDKSNHSLKNAWANCSSVCFNHFSSFYLINNIIWHDFLRLFLLFDHQ